MRQRLAIRHLFDWLVVGQIVPANPASLVRGPKHIVRKGKTPVLEPVEARALLDSIDVTTPIGLRDRALIGLMVYSFAGIGAGALHEGRRYLQRTPAALGAPAQERWQASRNALPPQPRNLSDGVIGKTGIANDLKGPLFRTIGRGTHELTRTPLPTANAYMMIKRRAAAAGL